jgi:hypothetical protein
MKNPDRKTVSQLEELPNVGKAIAGDLRLIGIQRPQDLVGKSPYDLFDELRRVTGEEHDPCVLDVFLSVVDFMEGGEPAPWWKFSPVRQKYMDKDQEEP